MSKGKFIFYIAVACGITILLLTLSDPSINVIPIVEPLCEMFNGVSKEIIWTVLNIIYYVIAYCIVIILINFDKGIENKKAAIKEVAILIPIMIISMIIGKFI